jgi:hypothetical protein
VHRGLSIQLGWVRADASAVDVDRLGLAHDSNDCRTDEF